MNFLFISFASLRKNQVNSCQINYQTTEGYSDYPVPNIIPIPVGTPWLNVQKTFIYNPGRHKHVLCST